MGSLIQDVRYAARLLLRQPGFSTAAVLSLALGLGVNTAVFSAMNTLIFRPLAVRDLDRTVYIYQATPENPDSGTSFSAYETVRTRTDIFSAVSAFTGARPLMMGDGEARETVYAEPVTSTYFSIADMRIDRGRALDPSTDSTTDPSLEVVLSHRFWQRRFGADPNVVGQRAVLNGRSFAIVGVAAPGFNGLDPEAAVDLWMPLPAWAHLIEEPGRLSGEEHWLTTIATLRDGVSLERAQASLGVAMVRSIRDRSVASSTDALVIGGAAFAVGLLVLVLACANVANLMIARVAARQREMAVRAALGGSRIRLIRMWVIETTMLSVVAATAGLFVASWLLDVAVAFRPPTLVGQAAAPTLPLAFSLDWPVFGFATGLAALTSIAIGCVTGLQSSNPRGGPRRFTPGFNLRSAVLASQMALSLLLLIPCGLLIRSSAHAATMTPGFTTDHVLLLPISSDQSGVRVRKPDGFEEQLLARVAVLPGVESATAMDPVPLWFGSNVALFATDADHRYRMGFSRIAPRYFATLRMALVQGRDFTSADRKGAPRVAIVNEMAARELWPAGAALGRHIQDGENTIEIVGVAHDGKHLGLAETPRPWVYLPLAQEPTNNSSLSLALRFAGDTSRLQAQVEREVRALVPSWPAFQFRSLEEGLELQRFIPRAGAALLGLLGLVGLLLASVGMYGVTAYLVKQRTREIGIRLALGSQSRGVVALVIRQGMVVCLAGAAAGLGLAFILTRFLTSVLVGTSAADPVTYALTSTFLIVVAVCACYLPARQAARTNPLDALRAD